jgi:AbrB family looped-hinge helix DNA binding protein
VANGNVNAVKTETIQIDKAGRVVLPKPLRDQFNLLPGDKLRLSVDGKSIKLEPTDAAGTLARKGSVLVFRGAFLEPITTANVDQLLGEMRDGRSPQTTAKTVRK